MADHCGHGRSASCAPYSDIFGRLDAGRTIEQLLAAQLAAMDRALAIHSTISGRLRHEAPEVMTAVGARPVFVERGERLDAADDHPGAWAAPHRATVPTLNTPLLSPTLALLSEQTGVAPRGHASEHPEQTGSPHIRQRLLHRKATNNSTKTPSMVVGKDDDETNAFWRSIAHSGIFEAVTFGVIIANAIWIGVDTDYNRGEVASEVPKVFWYVDNLFCSYFLAEIGIRWMAFTKCDHPFRDWIFMFDFFLAMQYVQEAWVEPALTRGIQAKRESQGMSSSVLRLFRLVRLTRVARISRLMRCWPELVITIKGLKRAVQSVMAMSSLLFIVIYVFAVMFVQLLVDSDVGEGHFDDVPLAMNFLLTQVVCGLDPVFFGKMFAESWIYYVLWLLFLFLCSLTIMNLLTGVLVDVVSSTAAEEKERDAMKELEEAVTHMMPAGCFGAGDFRELVQNRQFIEELDRLGVDTFAFEDFAVYHYEFVTEELSLDDLLALIFQFRGNKATMVKDIVDLRKFVTMELANLEARLVAPSGNKSNHT